MYQTKSDVVIDRLDQLNRMHRNLRPLIDFVFGRKAIPLILFETV